jgi:hypothetical protein
MNKFHKFEVNINLDFMKKIFFTIVIVFAFNFVSGQEIATTDSGKKVMLFDDGTYKVISSEQTKVKEVSNDKPSENKSVSVQCSGVTKKGKRCSRMVTNANGRCFQH